MDSSDKNHLTVKCVCSFNGCQEINSLFMLHFINLVGNMSLVSFLLVFLMDFRTMITGPLKLKLPDYLIAGH
jgi:hypothetical protein